MLLRALIVAALVLPGLSTPTAAAVVGEGAAATPRANGQDGPRLLVRFHTAATAAERTSALSSVGAVVDAEIAELGVTRVVLAGGSADAYSDLPDVAALLAKHPAVLSADTDDTVRLSLTPNDSYYLNDPFVGLGQWGIRKASVDRAWDTTRGSSNVIVAIVDSGVDPAHPDLAAALMPGVTFLSQPSSACTFETRDDNSHGTHVAGIVGATAQNATGVAGVAFGVRILPIKVLDCSGVGLMSDVASAIVHATNAGARVINVSLGSVSDSSTLRNAVSYATANGALVVASAGNCGTTSTTCGSLNQTQYPAADPNALAVAATDTDDSRASFSTQASYVDIAAPGRRIVSTTPTYATYVSARGGSLNYSAFSGTSQASPFVAAVAALILSAEPTLSVSELRSRLISTADDLGAAGTDTSFGAGRVNALRAVTAVQAVVPPAPAPTPAPAPQPSPTPAPSPVLSGGCATVNTPAPTATLYLPNVTKTLGGPAGFQTPFIVQNTGTVNTELEITFYAFSDGTCVTRRIVSGLGPGRSFADVPNNDGDLPGNSQFSVVVRSFGSPIVAVVNQHAGTGESAQALSYTGASSGSLRVFLPNITRRYFGFVTPFIVQNLGSATATATVTFRPFDGGAAPAPVVLSIGAGRSKPIDPNFQSGLADGKQYAVTVTGTQPLAVVVNTHLESATAPVGYSTNGMSAGASTVYGAYAAKNAAGRVSTIVVQNLGATPVAPSVVLTPLGSGSPVTVQAPQIAPEASWVLDPREIAALADGEYSFVASAAGGTIAAVVNVIGATTAMGYAAAPVPAARAYLPNVTRTLGGAGGFTTTVVIQGATATAATLSWYRFSDGALVHTQTVSGIAGRAVRVDPRQVQQLADDAQYAVVIDGVGGTLTAVAITVAAGGDNAMMYEAFPR